MRRISKGVEIFLMVQYHLRQMRERKLNGYYTRKINKEICEAMQKICNHECEDCPWYNGQEG